MRPSRVLPGQYRGRRRTPPGARAPCGSIAGNPVPGGYYRTPFWKKAMMIGGAVAGGEMLGDLLSGGGGYGGGWGGDDDGSWGGDDDGSWGGGGGDWGSDG